MSALLGIDATISQNLAAIVPSSSIEAHYLYRLLSAAYVHVREMGRGGNQEALNCDLVARMVLPFPPSHEQTRLTRYIVRVATALDRAATGATRQVKFLREYRTRLIADVVTGKLDVREAAAGLRESDSPVAESREA